MNIDEMMAELRVGYVADIPNKIKVIQKALDDNEMEQVRDGFHKLKGTGKTYGLPEITDLCAIVENLCIEKPEKIPQFAPLGLNILNRIFIARDKEQDHDLNSDKDFKQIESMNKA